jgi:putative PIN family toxin of toxin-antitoxin system
VAMRACLDTNLYISYLLNPLKNAPPATILRAGLRQRFSIVFGVRTIDEILTKVATKPYLMAHNPQAEVDELLWLLRQAGEIIADEPVTLPAICRDPKDDYLLGYSAIAQVDYLVSGDRDLLELGAFQGVRIVSPADFVNLVEQRD